MHSERKEVLFRKSDILGIECPPRAFAFLFWRLTSNLIIRKQLLRSAENIMTTAFRYVI